MCSLMEQVDQPEPSGPNADDGRADSDSIGTSAGRGKTSTGTTSLSGMATTTVNAATEQDKGLLEHQATYVCTGNRTNGH